MLSCLHHGYSSTIGRASYADLCVSFLLPYMSAGLLQGAAKSLTPDHMLAAQSCLQSQPDILCLRPTKAVWAATQMLTWLCWSCRSAVNSGCLQVRLLMLETGRVCLVGQPNGQLSEQSDGQPNGHLSGQLYGQLCAQLVDNSVGASMGSS